jgi:DNA-binding CsgD family transcriptional regulator
MALGDDDAYRMASGCAISLLSALRDRPMIEQLALEAYARGGPSPPSAMPNGVLFLSDLARVLLECGDRPAAERVLGDVHRLAESTADDMLVAAVRLVNARHAFLDGRLEDAIAIAGAWASDASTVTLRPSAPTTANARLLTARALHYLGRSADIDLALFVTPNRVIQASRATVLARLGQCDEALRIRARYGGIGDSADESGLNVLVSLLEASIDCRDARTAAALYERLVPFANRLQIQDLVSIGRLLGEAAIVLGRPDDARACLQQAFELCQDVSFLPELALIRLDIGELQLTHYPRERSHGIVQVRVALEELRAMGMLPAIDRATGLLCRVDSLPDSDASGLTTREREVAALLAAGRSNREIAEALVISEATVEVHVKRILAKLGFKSRSQVAAWVAETTH